LDKLKIEMLPIEQLIPYANNPRNNKKAIDKVAASIEEFGFKVPILIDQNNEIIAGHTRLLAAKKLDHKKVPVIKVTDLTQDQIKAFRIADNKTAEYSDWDFELLAKELEELKLEDYNIEFTGFDIGEAERLMSEFLEETEEFEDEVPEAPEEPVIKTGDIILLGKHKVICGDSTKKEDIEKLMDESKAKLIIIDAPYGVAYVGKTEDALTIQNDDLDDDELYDFLLKSHKNLYSIADDGCTIYSFHADTKGHLFRLALINAGFKLSQCCVWVKDNFVMGRQKYHWQHEPCLVGVKPTGKQYWNGDRKQSTVWNFDKPKRNAEHPTMKPIPLIEYIIKNSSKYGDLVVDTFLGSGSTLIAADRTDRICQGSEIDPKYCEVIIKRWINYKDGANGDSVFIIRGGEKYSYNDLVDLSVGES
jgi:DNA modification methylase